MGFFGIDQTDLDRLKSELQKKISSLQVEVDGLRVEVQQKATDSEETARTAAKNALDSEEQIKATRSRVDDALTTLESVRDKAKEESQKIQDERARLEANNSELLSQVDTTKELCASALELKDSITSSVEDVSRKIEKINTLVTDSQRLPDDVSSIEKLLEETKGLGDSMQDLLSHSLKRKAEIDELHKKILGYELEGNEGKVEHIDGIRDELEKTYKRIENKAGELEGEIQKLVDAITGNHENQLEQQGKTFEELVSNSQKRYASINDQLTGLLPGAMAEGLSAAYEKKKDDEIASLANFESSFRWAIGLMVAVSLIPFAVDLYLLAIKGADLVKVIKDTPSLLVSILPLYFPVLWLAYSANKKVNLSKRLIEEYTHKAVLGKTFSGLSNQIESLPRDGAVKDELRTRLLFNLLQVSSENPGKLISDYNKSDHPLMEALENSAKLSDSVDALSKIPGISVITKILNDKSEAILKGEGEKIEKGLTIGEALENKAP